MKKIDRKLVGDNPNEERILELARYYRRKSDALYRAVEKGNVVLNNYLKETKISGTEKHITQIKKAFDKKIKYFKKPATAINKAMVEFLKQFRGDINV